MGNISDCISREKSRAAEGSRPDTEDERLSFTACIVHYRDPAGVKRLISSMSGWHERPLAVIVADNSGELVGRDSELDSGIPVTVLNMQRNLGYAAALNRAMPSAGAIAEVVLVLTQDCELAVDCTKHLTSTIKREPECALAAPLLCFRSDPSVVFSAGGTLRRNCVTGHIAWKEPVASWLNETTCQSARVDWTDGACQMIRLSALEAVGGFDEAYFLYVEDIDICLRLAQSGYVVRCVRYARALQEPGAYSLYYRYRNYSYFSSVHRNCVGRFRVLRNLLVDSIRVTSRGRFGEIIWALRGLHDARRGHMRRARPRRIWTRSAKNFTEGF